MASRCPRGATFADPWPHISARTSLPCVCLPLPTATGLICRRPGWRPVRARWPPALALVALLAGCSDPGPASDPVPAGPGVITDPAMGLDQTGAHIHDYWGGQDRLVVIGEDAPADESGLGPGFATAGELEVRTFRPSSGNVVPQGTASVEVTFSWTDASDGLDSYGEASAWVKTAGTNASERIAVTGNGQTLAVETGLPDADLPHQLLSAWAFELRMSPPDGMPLRFKGVVALEVVAVRGLELPVFPPHPDPWRGRTEIPLVDASGQLDYWEDTGDGGSNGDAGPVVFTPASGAVVPGDSRHVAIEVTWTGGTSPLRLELWVHGSESRELAVAQPVTSGEGMARYEVAVEGPDGPYATQSQWEFTVKPVAYGPLRTAWSVQYSITAAAVRGT